MTPAPLFGLLLSLLGVGGLPEIVKIGERIFDAHAVCWMFSRLTYSQNNQAITEGQNSWAVKKNIGCH